MSLDDIIFGVIHIYYSILDDLLDDFLKHFSFLITETSLP